MRRFGVIACCIGVFSSAAMVVHAAQAHAPADSADCQVGVQLYSFRHDLDRDLPGTLNRIRQLGIQCVEPYSLHGRSAEQLRAELDRAGLRAVSFHLPGELRGGNPNEAVRVANVLGAKQVGIAWIKESERDAITEAKLMATAERLNAMCDAALAAGLRVFYHPHGYEFHEGDPGAEMFDRFVKALRKDCVVLQLDAFWVAFADQDPVKFLRRYHDRTWSFHVRDMSHQQKTAPFDGSRWQGPLGDEAFAVIGQGKIDWDTLFEIAPQTQIRWYIIEDESTRPFENIEAAKPYLRAKGLMH